MFPSYATQTKGPRENTNVFLLKPNQQACTVYICRRKLKSLVLTSKVSSLLDVNKLLKNVSNMNLWRRHLTAPQNVP
jgi:hypothetical protein